MSAWMCDNDHLSALAAYAVEHRLAPEGLTVRDVGMMFWAENMRSLDYRYRPEPRPAFVLDAKGTRLAETASPAAIAMSAACYSYQACEHPEWDSSLACRIATAIEAHAIKRHGRELTSEDCARCFWGEPRDIEPVDMTPRWALGWGPSQA